MLARIRSRAVWMAAGLTLAGGAFAIAGVPTDLDTGNEISETAKVDPQAVSDLASAKDESESSKAKSESRASKRQNGERKQNHGYFVSRAAHCEDVEQGEFDFNAPGDCESDGAAHGEYVGSVAESDIGKKEHDGG